MPRPPAKAQQLADQLDQQINAGQLSPGSWIPSERALSLTYNMDRSTVRRALRTLATRGIIVMKPGFGAQVVNASSRSQRESDLGSTTPPLPKLDWERLSQSLKTLKRVNEATVNSLESETTAFQQLDLNVPSGQLLPYLTSHINRLSDVLRSTVELKLRRRLVMTTGEAVELAGWLAWDNGDETSAQRLYQIAITASREADYPPLLAYCLADMSNIPSCSGDARHAENLISQAMEKLDPNSFPINYSWLEARQAEELARQGNPQALSLIESSLQRFNSADPMNETLWTGFLTLERMENFALNVYLQLNRHREASDLVKRAVERKSYNKLQPVILGDIATLYLKTGNFEEGMEIAAKALESAINVRSGWILGRLNPLHALLAERASLDHRAAQLIEQFKID